MGAVGGWLFLFKILLPYEKESKHKGHRPGKENIMNELWYKVRRVISVMLVVALSVTRFLQASATALNPLGSLRH